MTFWWILFICNMLLPGLMIFAGYMMRRHCPKKINMWVGYRTRLSMKNEETWRFAHEHCGRLWYRLGLILLLPTAAVQLPFMHSAQQTVETAGVIICIVLSVILVAAAFPTQIALKRNFTEDGERRR